MCGISGIISLNNVPISSELLVSMTDVLASRGPEGEGYLITNQPGFSLTGRGKCTLTHLQNRQHMGLGHRRLSINDLSPKAAQPMTETQKRYWLVFNGQIYNHAELRKELESKGYSFNTDHSDTEVILNAYSCWGKDCVKHFNGMWAFCLWDSLENTFFISRDRIGKQPLYYTVADNTFYFSSEFNSLLTNKKLSREMDDQAVYDYLTYTFVPAPKTMFRNIFKLPAGHYFFFRPGEEIRAIRYWSPESAPVVQGLSEEDILEQIRQKLFQATRYRMTADVEVGMLLSGGLDSSIILACMQAQNAPPVKAYTVGFENKEDYRNEFYFAKNVADYFGADLTNLVVTERDFFDFLPEMAYLQDEPAADTANIPLYLISRVASKDNIKVLLSGEGADELFVGYEHWRLIYHFEKLMRNKPILAGVLNYAHKNSIFKNKGTHYQTWNYKVKNNWPVFWSGTELRTEEEKGRILQKDFLNGVGDYNSFSEFEELYNKVGSNGSYDTFRWMTIADLQHRLPDLLLSRLDRAMMSASIEGRNPFLDVDLVEFVLGVDSGLKVKEKKEKYLLKKAFKGSLPPGIVDRAKDSFTIPLTNLFSAARLKEYAGRIESINKTMRIFKDDYLKQIQAPDKMKEFWNVLNLVLWYEKHK